MSVFNPTWISKIPRGPKYAKFHVVATKWTKEYVQRTCKVTTVLTSSHWWNNVMKKRHNDMNVSIDWRDITKAFQIFFMSLCARKKHLENERKWTNFFPEFSSSTPPLPLYTPATQAKMKVTHTQIVCLRIGAPHKNRKRLVSPRWL